jgi:hypothetical protein
MFNNFNFLRMRRAIGSPPLLQRIVSSSVVRVRIKNDFPYGFSRYFATNTQGVVLAAARWIGYDNCTTIEDAITERNKTTDYFCVGRVAKRAFVVLSLRLQIVLEPWHNRYFTATTECITSRMVYETQRKP